MPAGMAAEFHGRCFQAGADTVQMQEDCEQRDGRRLYVQALEWAQTAAWPVRTWHGGARVWRAAGGLMPPEIA